MIETLSGMGRGVREERRVLTRFVLGAVEPFLYADESGDGSSSGGL